MAKSLVASFFGGHGVLGPIGNRMVT